MCLLMYLCNLVVLMIPFPVDKYCHLDSEFHRPSDSGKKEGTDLASRGPLQAETPGRSFGDAGTIKKTQGIHIIVLVDFK